MNNKNDSIYRSNIYVFYNKTSCDFMIVFILNRINHFNVSPKYSISSGH